MSGRSAFVLSVRKDLRAMAPTLLASVGVMVAVLLLQRRFAMAGYSSLRLMGVGAYVLGAVALGALVVGHEYLHRTMGWLLVQPVSRRRLLLAKIAALGAGLLLMAAARSLFLTTAATLDGWFGPFYFLNMRVSGQSHATWTLTLLPLLGGLCVAPWLTMVFRNVLAGIVFTIFVPALVWLVADVAISITFRQSGFVPGDVRDLSVQVLWYWSVAFCAAGAVFGWRRFMRLEARDEPAMGLAFESATRHTADAGRTRPSSPAIALLCKELRIHQMVFVLAGLYAVVYAGLQIAVPVGPEFVANVTTLLFTLYVALLTLLIGASSVAEERRLGTTEWQVLLPVAVRRQWAIKVSVVLTLAIVLVGAVPWLMAKVVAPIEPMRRVSWEPVVALAVVLLVAVYVSSWARDGLRALLLSVVVLTGGAAVLALSAPVQQSVQISLMPSLDALAARVFPDGLSGRTVAVGLSDRATKARIDRGVDSLKLVLVAFAGALLLRFGYRNYRASYVTRRSIGRQLGWLLTTEIAGAVLFAVLTQAGWAVFNQEPWVRRAQEQFDAWRSLQAAPTPSAPASSPEAPPR